MAQQSQQVLAEDINTDIASLQKIQDNLLSKLEAKIDTLTPTNKEQLVSQINEVTTMMLELYGTVKTSQSFYNDNTLAANNTLEYQTNALDVINLQVIKANNVLKQLGQEQANKYRLVEINDYYTQQYSNHISILKAIMLFLVIVIVLIFLKKRGFLPERIYFILLIAVLSVGVIYVVTRIRDAYLRSNMYYDEYMYLPPPKNSVSGVTTGNTIRQPSTTGNGCSDQSCCPVDYTYLEGPNKCIINTPTKPGCYVYSESGCPQHKGFNTHWQESPAVPFKANKWAIDTYGMKNTGSGDSEEKCNNRKPQYNSFCHVSDFKTHFNPPD